MRVARAFVAALALLQLASVACELPQVEIHYTFKPEACERKAKLSDILTLHYKGSLADGQMFDSSHERSEPFSFQLGGGQVIQGWEKGLLGVCVGERRKLVVPPELGYGDTANAKIPAKSTLVFDVEVLAIKDGPKPANVFKDIDTDGNQKLSRREISDYLKLQLAASAAGHLGDPGSPADESEHRQMVEEIFNQEDRDRDGEISFEEFSGPKHDHDEL